MKKLVSTVACLGARLLAPALILGGLLPGCFLDRSGLVSPWMLWSAEATVVNRTDGTRMVVRYGNLTLDSAAGMAVEFMTRTDGSTVEVVEDWFKRYLRERLAAGAASGDEAFRMAFGDGTGATNWCYLPGTLRAIFQEGRSESASTEPSVTGPPLEECSAPPALPEECSSAGEAQLQFDEDPVEFGSVGVSVESMLRPVVLRNAGGPRVCVAPVRIVGRHPDDFSFEPGTCAPDPSVPGEIETGFKFLEDGGSCALLLRFRPAAGGGRGAQLQVNSNDPQAPALPLRGTGEAGTLSLVEVSYFSPDAFTPVSIPEGGQVCVPAVEPANEVYAAFFRIRNVGSEGRVAIQSRTATAGWSLDLWVPSDPAVSRVTLAPGETLQFRLRSDLRTPVSRPDPALVIFNGNQTNNPLTFRTDLQAVCP